MVAREDRRWEVTMGAEGRTVTGEDRVQGDYLGPFW